MLTASAFGSRTSSRSALVSSFISSSPRGGMRGVCGRAGSLVVIGDTVDDVSPPPCQRVQRPPVLLPRPARGAARSERRAGRGVRDDLTLIGRRDTTGDPDRDERAATGARRTGGAGSGRVLGGSVGEAGVCPGDGGG